MKQDEYWNRFMESGSVEDYLGFCAVRDQERDEKQSRTAGKTQGMEKGGAGSRTDSSWRGGRDTGYAGLSDSDGHGAKDRSRGGI